MIISILVEAMTKYMRVLQIVITAILMILKILK